MNVAGHRKALGLIAKLNIKPTNKRFNYKPAIFAKYLQHVRNEE